MIAKHVPMKVLRKSNYVGLVTYITDSKNKRERVGQVSVTHCHSSDPHDAALEVQAKQALNQRVESDKTYHLIVSFAANENPAAAILKDVETRICEALGYSEHQRISAVHHDTDYLHIHIAINKIHPTKLTIHVPYYDYKTLGQICDQLETEYGLVKTNHQTRQRGAASRAVDMESAAGIESLLGWIQRECLEDMQKATSWAELHHILGENSLEISERANGLVITDHNGTRVKASSVSRDFSKKKLEEKLGQFVPPLDNAADHEPKQAYHEQPMPSKMDTTALYARYRDEQQFNYGMRTTEWKQAREKKNRLIEEVKRNNRLKRATIKLTMDGGVSKKILYALAYKTLQEDIQKIREQYTKERQLIYEKYNRRAWNDWLQYKAGQGDSEALEALRARETVQSLHGNTVGGKTVKNTSTIPEMSFDSVTKKGVIIYRVGASAIRDDGDNLKVSHGATRESLVAALQMAVHRYGEKIIVNGSDEFKTQIVMAAVDAKLALTFDNPALEQRRQELINTQKEKTHELRTERSLGGSTRQAGQRTSQRTRQTDKKPNIGRVGTQPPPRCKNYLRHLSELSLVYHQRGDQMLLPRDVSSHMEQRGSEGTHGVRREIYREGHLNSHQMRAAADHYIAEREAKRLAGIDILKHVLYNREADTVMTFSGIRRINEQPLALLKHEQEIMVLPIDEKMAKKLKKLSIGDSVMVQKGGVISIKGRSRKM